MSPSANENQTPPLGGSGGMNHSTDDFSTLTLHRSHDVATISLNRPRTANALTALMVSELRQVQQAIAQESTLRVAIITGAGKHFCAGRDLRDTEPLPAGGTIDLSLLEIPTIAAINGAAVGGGCELALACDFRIADHQATFSLPEIRFGELPAAGATARLPRIIGASRARRMILTGQQLNASEALQIGLIDEIATGVSVLDAAHALAAQIAQNAPYAVRAAKLLLERSLETDIETALRYEKRITDTMASDSERQRERLALADRDPTYKRIFSQ